MSPTMLTVLSIAVVAIVVGLGHEKASGVTRRWHGF